MNYSWESYPYPHLVLDNFLSNSEFQKLIIELDKSQNQIQKKFISPLERKSIYKSNKLQKESANLISLMSSNSIKRIISEIIGSIDILSMGETSNYSGYSPFHITNNEGFLGAHVDHSSIKKGKFRHIANTIFFASSSWEKDWGGETILFSKNGFKEKKIIDPLPNRLLIFIHSSNSFHGVRPYLSNLNIQRRTFYHDYYVGEDKIKEAMKIINSRFSITLKHSFHTTTFIPFLPFGIKKIDFRKLFSYKNIKYIKSYCIYIFNYLFNTNFLTFKELKSSLMFFSKR